jgi:hypothetical protein
LLHLLNYISSKVNFLFLVICISFLAVDAFAQLSGFDYRKKYTIDNSQVSGSTDLTNFPVLVSITDADLADELNSGYVTNSNGFDIAFTSSDGTSQLDHELTSFDDSTGEVIAWVRFPILSATVDTDFYIYFGNSSISTDQSTTSTWASEFGAVYHLNDDYDDATSNANNCKNNGTSFVTSPAQIGSAADYDAATDFIDCGSASSLQPTATITLSAWVRSDVATTKWEAIGGFASNTYWADGYGIFFNSGTTVHFSINKYKANFAASSINANTNWRYVVGTYDRDSGGPDQIKIYVDGSLGATVDNYSSDISYLGGNVLQIGQLGGWTRDWLNGQIDEFRLTNAVRSGEWITTEFNNQSSPGTFYTLSPENPVLASTEVSPLTVTAGGAATVITETITISTPFIDSLESATIEISSNVDNTEDVLAFSNTSLISGILNSGTGILTLTGRASLADYQAALRSVTYQNTDGSSPDLSARTISITVDDLFESSNVETRDIYVTQGLTELSTDIANTVFHFDAQDIDGDLDLGDQPADGSSVTSWGDRSDNAGGSAVDITTLTIAGDKPIFDSNYFGERGGIFFDYNSGTNGDNIEVADNAILNQSNFTAKSFAAVFRTGTDLTGLQIVYEQGSQNDGYQISIKDGNLYAYAWTNNSGGFDESIDLGSVSVNESYIVIANHNNTIWEASVNGGSITQSPGTAGLVGSSEGDPNIGEEDGTSDPVTFAGNPASRNNFDGFLGELISWNTALSAGQVASIHSFLCDKWCNEAPVLSGIEGTNLDFTEGDSPISITSSIVLSDSDNTVLDSAKVSISANFESSEDELAFTNTGSITGNWNRTTGVLTLTGNTTIANYQSALRSITYENTNSINPNTSIRQIDFFVFDWDDSSNVQSRNINVISVNSTPTLSGVNGNSISINEGDTPATLGVTSSITDADDVNIESALIAITSNYFNGEDVLSFVDTGSISGSFNAITGELTLKGSASIADYQTALDNVLYQNTSSDPVELTRTVSFSVNDGDNNSNTQSSSITVSATNSPPEFSSLEETDLTYPNDAINITNSIELTDPDDLAIDSVLVLITGNFKSNEDSLIYSTLFGITGTYDETAGKLKLEGSSSFSDYETAIRSIEYKNYATIPTGPERTLSFLAYDDDQAESDTVKRVIEVSAVESIDDLLVWLRADTGVDTTAGGEVITWEDQSGNGHDFTGQDNGTNDRPTIVSSSSDLGYQPAIEFLGNGDHFNDSDGDTDYINGLEEFSLFLVYKSDETNSDQGIWIADSPSGADEIFTIRYYASGANTGGSFTNAIKTGIRGNTTANQLVSFSDIQTTGAQITSLHWENGVNYDLYVDGILNNPAAAGSPPTGAIANSTTAIVGKGGKDTGNNSWNGLIAEVILYGRDLSEDERENIEDYLSVKYSSAIRKITAATGGESISADDANTTFTSLTGPVIQERFAGELTNSGTIKLTAPSGYRFNSGAVPGVTVDPTYGGSTTLSASYTSYAADSTSVTFTISAESTSNPGQITFSGLEIRPNTGILPNSGNIINTGTTGQGGATNYGTLTMIAGAADSLTFDQQPTITNIDSTISPSVRIQLVDQFGNSVESAGTNISISKASGSGTLSGTSPVATNALGIADFSDLSITSDLGDHKLVASSAGLASDTSDVFEIVNAGTLTSFTIERFPSGSISAKQAGQTFDVVITAIDGTAATVTTFTGTVSISSSCTMGSGQGTTTSFSSGVLSSHTVSITSIGNCTLTATNSSGSENGTSNTFTVSPGASDETTTTISASPSVILNNGSSTSTITVQLKDAFGNDLTSNDQTVLLSTDAGTLGTVTDNADGTATATLTSSIIEETATITGTLGGASISDDAEVEFSEFTHIWYSQLGSPSDASNWDDLNNWFDGNDPALTLPNSSSVVLIPTNPQDGNEYPVIDMSNTIIQELVLETNAEVTVSGSINFEVSGDITGDGDLLGTNNDSLTIGGDLNVADITLGTVVFDGATEQTILGPHSYVNVEVDNSTTVNVTSDFNVSGTLTLTDGELLIPSDINLIANTQSYGSGELRFQREITGSIGWRMITSPVSSNYDDFLDGMLTQGYLGAFYSTASSPGDTLQPNILTYLESDPGTDNQRYRTPTDSSVTLTEGQGIWAFFFGDIAADSRYNDPLPDTLDVNGQEFNGNGTEVDFGITYTTTADSGWNFVGNPFGATIDWDDSPNWTKTNVESTIYIWDPAANGGNGEYLTWNGVTGTLGDGLISPFQGFWVKANASSPSLKVNLDAKTTGGDFIRKQVETDVPLIEMEASINGLSKRTNIMFTNDGDRKRDEFDGLRLVPFSNTHVEFYSLLNDGTQLAINNLPRDLEHRVNIPLVINAFENGQAIDGALSLSWAINRSVPQDWLILLIDNQTGKTTNLRSIGDYFVDFSTSGKLIRNTSPLSPDFKFRSLASNSNTRFTLRITSVEIESRIPNEIFLDQNYPNPFNPSTTITYGITEAGPVLLEVYDIIGRKIQTLVNSDQFEGQYNVNFDASRLASGIYFYRLTAPSKVLTKRMTLIK